jgi:hypothetical protein
MAERLMTNIATEEVAAISLATAQEDLSEEIERSVERQPDERVRAVRVFDECYRCNWWVQDPRPQLFWLLSATIRKGRFLRVAKTRDGLLVEDMTGVRGSVRPMEQKGGEHR